MAAFEWLFISGVCVLLGSVLIGSFRTNQQQERLKDAFYELLEAENGCLSLIQLAVEAGVDGQTAKQFLDEQVRLFGAEIEVDKDGDTFYRFPKLRRVEGVRRRDDW